MAFLAQASRSKRPCPRQPLSTILQSRSGRPAHRSMTVDFPSPSPFGPLSTANSAPRSLLFFPLQPINRSSSTLSPSPRGSDFPIRGQMTALSCPTLALDRRNSTKARWRDGHHDRTAKRPTERKEKSRERRRDGANAHDNRKEKKKGIRVETERREQSRRPSELRKT
jgi:hypothetical protein